METTRSFWVKGLGILENQLEKHKATDAELNCHDIGVYKVQVYVGMLRSILARSDQRSFPSCNLDH